MNINKFNLPPVNLEATNLSDEWKHWLEAFENYRIATKLNKEDDAVQRATLLHLAGTGVQRLLSGLPGSKEKFEEVKTALTTHFQPKKNKWAERYRFRKRAQKENESVDTFIAELRVLSLSCDFGETVEDNILGQVIEKCYDGYLREKLLQQGDTLTLEKAQTLGRAIEHAKKDTVLLGGEKSASLQENVDVNQVKKTTTTSNKKSKNCFRCGRDDHLANDEKCRAKDAECRKCKRVGHYAKCCRSSNSGKDNNKEEDHQVKVVEQTSQDTDEYNHEYINYACKDGGIDFTIDVEINGKQVDMIIDTGCARTLVPKQWFKENINCPIRHSTAKFTAFGGGELKCLGTFDAKLGCKGQEIVEPVFVIDVDGPALLGRSAILALNLIKVHAVGEGPANERGCILKEYADVFKEELGEFKDYEYDIKINNEVPPKVQRQRPVPAPLESKLKEEIERMIKEDVIEEASGASWVSPVHIVYKGDGEIRICIDLREANKAVIRERFPIPRIQDLLRQLSGAKMFSTLDLRKAYWQIRLSEESREITSFMAAGKVYQFKRLPFGLASAPEAYQRVMSIVCEGLTGVLNYFDDVVVYGSTPEEHWHNLRAMLDTLRAYGLRLNAKKCVMGVSELKFLGHIISVDGIRPDPEKVRAIVEAPVPEDQAQLRSFLGSITYLTQYVPHLATIIAPLRKLTQKGITWKWTTAETLAYDQIKKLLVQAPCLAHYSMNADAKLVVDASPWGLGCVLLQEVDNQMRPVAYASRGLTDVEKRYAQIEREALAVLYGLQKMHTYIYGRKITVSTDHKPLVGVFAKPTQSIRLERIALRAQDYDFTLIYEPGSGNIADGLSRLPTTAPSSVTNFVEEHVRFVKKDMSLLSIEEIQEAGKADAELQRIKVAINEGWTKLDESLKRWIGIKEELTYAQGLLWRGRRIFVPALLRTKALRLAHEAHQGIVRSKQRLRASLFWPGMDSDIEEFCRNCETCVRLQPLRRDTPCKPTPLPDHCWDKCAIDLVGPFPGQVYILTLVDYRSKWPEAAIMKTTTSSKVITVLTEIFARFGNPRVLVSDNGPQFVSEEFEGFLKANGIQHSRVAPYYPKANGQVERFHRYLEHSIRAAEIDGFTWTEVLPDILQVYRSTPHAGTKMTPAKVMLNREITTKLPMVPENERGIVPEERYQQYQEKLRIYADRKRHAEPHGLAVGDIVFVANMSKGKLTPNFSGDKYVILNQKGRDTFELVEVETGKRVIRNAKFLREVPPHSKMTRHDVEEQWLEQPERTIPQPVNPLDDRASSPQIDEIPVILPEEEVNHEAEGVRRSTRNPKPRRDTDYLYY